MSYYAERYRYLKNNKRCVKCGKRDAHTLVGKAYCHDCTEKRRKYHRKNYERHKEVYLIQKKERYEKQKSESLCTCCGKREVENDRTMCSICSNRRTLANRRRKNNKGFVLRRDRMGLGLCLDCCNPVVDGYRYCEKCLPKHQSTFLKINEARVKAKKIEYKKQENQY